MITHLAWALSHRIQFFIMINNMMIESRRMRIECRGRNSRINEFCCNSDAIGVKLVLQQVWWVGRGAGDWHGSLISGGGSSNMVSHGYDGGE
jgi:hypothetical protein